jgi:hypothetical protein
MGWQHAKQQGWQAAPIDGPVGSSEQWAVMLQQALGRMRSACAIKPSAWLTGRL